MKTILTELDLKQISLENQPFIINYPITDSMADPCYKGQRTELCGSIEKYGLLCPIIVFIVQPSTNGQIFLIHGVNRFLACQYLGWSAIPCSCLDPYLSEQDLYLLSLSMFLSHKKPNTAEQTKIIQRLLLFWPKERIIREYLPRLGLYPSEKVFERIHQLVNLEDEMAHALASQKIELDLALRLLKLQPGIRKQIYRFLISLPFTLSQSFEVIEYLEEISIRDNIAIDQVLEDAAILEIQNKNDRDIDNKQRLQAIRSILRQKRYPRLTELENNFTLNKKRLKLPPNIELYPPPNFEHGRYRLELKFTNSTEFKQQLDLLNRIETDIFK